jgi:galactofuranose transport system permease protein
LKSDLKWPLITLIVVLVINAISSPAFFSIHIVDGRLYGSLIDIINRAVPVLLIALGMTLVIATRGVDLSVGAVMAISGSVAASLLARPSQNILSHLPPFGVPALVGVALLFALGAGLFNGVLVVYCKVQPIVATLILMVAGRGIAQLIADGQVVIFQNPSFKAIGNGAFLAIPIPIWIFLVSFAVVTFVLKKTALGLFVAATGSSPSAAKYCGVNSALITLVCYMLCATFAGVSGIIMTADIAAADANNLGQYFELDAILAVAIGGTRMNGGRFTIMGSVLGAILMQTVTTTMLSYGVPSEITQMLKAVLVIVVCLTQSEIFRNKFSAIRGRRTA